MAPQPRRQLVGGPLCGLVVRPPSGKFAWVTPDGRATAERREGAELYRADDPGYVYAGHGALACPCGAVSTRAPGSAEPPTFCPLCGERAASRG